MRIIFSLILEFKVINVDAEKIGIERERKEKIKKK